MIKASTLTLRALSAILICAILITALPVSAESTGLNVTYRSQSDIQQFFNEHPFSLYDENEFDILPSFEEPYSYGSLSEECKNSSLNAINMMRYIAGLDANVTLDDTYNQKASAAAYILALNGEGLSHYPERPDQLADSKYDDLYELGYSAASSSNIGGGYKNNNQSLINGYMDDSDSNNINRVGHRRWILNPTMGKIGFGAAVNADSYYGRYYAMYAFDRSGSGGQSLVAWPSYNTPLQYFTADTAWSISIGSAVTASDVTVTLTRASDNTTWSFSESSADGEFYVNNNYYGQPGCIIFRPSSLESISAGDSFHVKITGAVNADIEYDVNFFSLDTKASENNWSFDAATGTLYLKSGTKMPNYLSLSNVPWASVNNQILSVIISDGISNISDYAFYNCSNLTSVTLPTDVGNIGKYAFYGCSSLNDVYYSGSADKWAQINIKSNNSALTSAELHCHYNCNGTFGEYIIDTAATCTENGIKHHICGVCGESESIAIPALGHSFGEWQITLPSTCISMGSQYHICTSCGFKEDNTIPYSAHSFEDYWCTVCGCGYEILESEHPYPNGADVSQSATFEKAEYLLVSFSDETFTESNWDFIYIYNGSGALIGEYTGSALTSQTVTVTGDTVTLQLISDGSVSKYGYYATVTPVYPDFETGDLNGNGDIDIIDLIRLKKRIAILKTDLLGSADINSDGSINAADLTLLRRTILGI